MKERLITHKLIELLREYEDAPHNFVDRFLTWFQEMERRNWDNGVKKKG